MTKRKLANDSPSLCIAAIDFGTSGTGFALGFKHSDQGVARIDFLIFASLACTECFHAGISEEIICREPGGQEAKKAPTVLLLDQQKKFVAFGARAQERYYESDYSLLLFERFKMNLHRLETISAMATALNGR